MWTNYSIQIALLLVFEVAKCTHMFFLTKFLANYFYLRSFKISLISRRSPILSLMFLMADFKKKKKTKHQGWTLQVL